MAKKPAKQERAGRDPKGRFPKGVSGNPAGRPPLAEAFAQAIRDGDKDRLLKAIDKTWEKAARGDLRAFEFLADHGWGRLPQAVTGGGEGSEPIEILVRHVKA